MSKTKINKRIGKDLRFMRKVHHISQVQLGKVLGLHQTAVCRIEEGKQTLTAEDFIKLRAWFDTLPNVFRDEV